MLVLLLHRVNSIFILWDLQDEIEHLRRPWDSALELNMLPQMVFGNMNFTNKYKVRKGRWNSAPSFQSQQFGFLNSRGGDLFLITPEHEPGLAYFQLLDPKYVDEKYILSELNYPLTAQRQPFDGEVLLQYSTHERFKPVLLRECAGQLFMGANSSSLWFSLQSEQCQVDMQGLVDLEEYQQTHQLILYCLMMMVLGLAKIVLVYHMSGKLDSQAFAARVSLGCVCALTYSDIADVLVVAYIAIINNSHFLIFLPMLFLWFMLVFLLEFGALKKIRDSHYIEEINFIYYFNLALFLYIVLFFYLFSWAPFCCLCALYPSLQIRHNAVRGSAPTLPRQLLGLFCLKLLESLYLRGCPQNFYKYQPNEPLCIVLVVLYAAQVFTLHLQSLYGARFFLRKDYYPHKFDYFDQPLIELEDICPICHDLMRPSLRGEDIWDQVIQTPCRHYFHCRCLQGWLHIAKECPSCRQPLPEF